MLNDESLTAEPDADEVSRPVATDPETVRLAHISAHWDRCVPFMQAALDEGLGEFDIDDVRIKLESGWAQLWPLPNGCMVTEVTTHATGKRFLSAWLSGGNLQEIQEAEPRVAAWAKAAGCERVVLTGRPGWLRAFKGYRPAYLTMTKEL